MKIERSKYWKGEWIVIDDDGKTIAHGLSKTGAKLVADTSRRVGFLDKVRSGEMSAKDVIDGTPDY